MGGRAPVDRVPAAHACRGGRRRRARLPFFLRRPGARTVSEQFGRETAAAKRPVTVALELGVVNMGGRLHLPDQQRRRYKPVGRHV